MPKPGRDWGVARPRHSPAKLARAVKMRQQGLKLAEIERRTGVSMSYLSRMLRAEVRHGHGRLSALPATLILPVLRARLTKLEREAKEIRAQIRRLTDGKPKDGAGRGVGTKKAPRAHPAPGDGVRSVPPPTEGPSEAAD